jgi:SAM-dependent methyltransferase
VTPRPSSADDIEQQARRDHSRRFWSLVNAQIADEHGQAMWASNGIGWGLFRVREEELGVLGDVAGLDAVELGCGTAFLSAGLARAGARLVGIDLSPAQLASARRSQARHGPRFPLIEADAEHVPLRDASFDLVVSEYGAAPWCEPQRWLAEAARLLRPGGRLVFLTNSVLAGLCVPSDGGVAGEQLQRPQRDLARIEWPGGSVEQHPGHGDWIRELGAAGFVVDALHELYAPGRAVPTTPYDIVTPDWARRWPAEDLWVAHVS